MATMTMTKPKTVWLGSLREGWSFGTTKDEAGLHRVRLAKPVVLHGRPRFATYFQASGDALGTELVVSIHVGRAPSHWVFDSILLDNVHPILRMSQCNIGVLVVVGWIPDDGAVGSLLIRGSTAKDARLTAVDLLRVEVVGDV